MATGFEEGSGVKGGTRYMATYATGVLPGREGLTGCAGGCRRYTYVPADLAGRHADLELGLHVVQEGGAA